MKKLYFIGVVALLLSGCGVKDPSFYDLKSPCVSIKIDNTSSDPCIRTSPQINQFYDQLIKSENL